MELEPLLILFQQTQGGPPEPSEVFLGAAMANPGLVLAEMRMIVLERQDVVAAAGDDLGGDLLLAARGVDGEDGVIQVQQLQELK